MDHITATIATATPDQIARAHALAKNFAALSGIQSWSGATDHRLPLYNIVLSDRDPTPKIAPATAAGTIPNYSVPVTQTGALHSADRALLLDWLRRWPASVTVVRINAPRLGDSAILPREGLIAALTA